ncbi:MAG: nitroreductase [Pseudomonadota bacterium]|nr:nitroreductase [Pseudomonadota bacterium]
MSDSDALAGMMRARFSCRAFLPDAVPEATIRRIVEASRWAASWSNVQPWEMLITRPETTRKLADRLVGLARARVDAAPDAPFPPAFEGVHLRRRREVGFGLYNALGIARDDRAAREAHFLENFRFFGAPHVALVTMPAGMGVYGALDAGNFLSCFMLAAHAEGVATIAQAALAQYAGAIREMFQIAADRAFLCGVSFGYADMAHPANGFRAARAAADEIFRFV